ncbi:hypothetical protein ACFPOI_46915 [Nonomuraea angiospora]|uniref:Uncharacterized protein n=1 Tax=Nonomuraea angiospora TaxID=46172 RepID=A0ABR9LZC6_9ACTN|nr:hypothetical protein [Nonomuraea angiospora]MBE1585643.1 hypothetical protein [Nonomuraea angiospora]
MRRRAHLLATAALLATLGSAVVLGSIPGSDFHPITQRIANSLVLTDGYLSTVNAVLNGTLGDPLGSVGLPI